MSSLKSQVSSLKPAASRRGISLLEVLISMGVLVVGLMGVAALIPAGRSEILVGAKIDHAAAVARQAFHELKARNLLSFSNWYKQDGTTVGVGSVFADYSNTLSITLNCVLDPLGMAAPVASFGNAFPTTYNPSNPGGITRISPYAGLNATIPAQAATIRTLADPIFRSPNDLGFVANASRNQPPNQQVFKDGGGVAIKRYSEGNYSWMATICTEPVASSFSKATVSVVVFYKRDLTNLNTEYSMPAALLGGGVGGGEVQLSGVNPAKPLKTGQFIMLAGDDPRSSSTSPLTLAFWYQIIAAENPSSAGVQNVTLRGRDFLPSYTTPRAFFVENVVGVFERVVPLYP